MNEFNFCSDDGISIHVYHWPSERPRAAMQIVHGGSEHAARYARLAATLNEAGYEVYASDLRGHGKSALPGKLGIFAADDGWNRAVADLAQLNGIITERHPDLPIALLGHSMGSLMGQQYLVEHGNTIAALVLSGSTLAGGFAELVPMLEAELAENGRDVPCQFMGNMLDSGGLNMGIDEPKTAYDWLTRDAEEVQKYIDDPLCGFTLSIGAWLDLSSNNRIPITASELARAPKPLPIYIFSGERDPSSNHCEALQELLALYAEAGLENVSHRFYPGCRHEPLHETNRDEVTADLIAWLSESLP